MTYNVFSAMLNPTQSIVSVNVNHTASPIHQTGGAWRETAEKKMFGEFISKCIAAGCLFFFLTRVLILSVILSSVCICCLLLRFSSKFDAPHN